MMVYTTTCQLVFQAVIVGSDDVELTLHGENLDVLEMNRYYEVVLRDMETNMSIVTDILYDQISNSTLPLRVSTDQDIPYGLRMDIWVSVYSSQRLSYISYLSPYVIL